MKKIGFFRFIAFILCMSILFTSMAVSVAAFTNFEVEVTKNNAPLRKGCGFTEKVISKIDKGTHLTVVSEKRNWLNNLWYEIDGGGYIYSGNVKKVHVCNTQFVGYESMHPHPAKYECSCGNGYCSMTEYGKMDNCSMCNTPENTKTDNKKTETHKHNYEIIGYESNHPHYAMYQCTECASGYSGTKTSSVEGCSKCGKGVLPNYEPTVCLHSYSLVRYEDEHPHHAVYKCGICGDTYTDTNTHKQKGCNICYPHVHNYEFIEYQSMHPHYASYKCTGCSSGYSSSETKIISTCYKCNPVEEERESAYDDDCSDGHDYEFVTNESKHPHYAVYQCYNCGILQSRSSTSKVKDCSKCYPNLQYDYEEPSGHRHSYHFIAYEEAHPHYAFYECDCGEGYYSDKTTELEECEECFPEVSWESDDGWITKWNDQDKTGKEDHECEFVFLGKYEFFHPHYAIKECSYCAKTKIDLTKFGLKDGCFECYDPHDPYPNYQIKIYNINDERPMILPDSAKAKVLSDAEDLHMALDICGFVPGVGEVCDGINVAYYLIEGDIENALLSGVAFIHFIGIVSNLGKVIKKPGILILTKVADKIGDIKRLKVLDTITNFAPLSDDANLLINTTGRYSDEFLESVAKITQNQDLPLEKVFSNGDSLIGKYYTGTVTSPAGLKYTWDGKWDGKLDTTVGEHRIYHILRRHTDSIESASKGSNVFSIGGEEVLKLIDDTYLNKKPIPGTEEIRDVSISYDYEIGKVIGTQNETKMRIVYDIYDPTYIVTAYPIK